MAKDTTENFPAACKVVITNRASAFYGMVGHVCGRDIASQTIQVIFVGGQTKTCATECISRLQ